MKSKRQSLIIEFINKSDIETQEELAEMLKNHGFNVTQATISRDIRDLKLTKVLSDSGKQKYISLYVHNENEADSIIRSFRNVVVSIEAAQNILVVKTMPGMAMAIAAAIETLDYEELVGNIAGDDTIFCVAKTNEQTASLKQKITRILNIS